MSLLETGHNLSCKILLSCISFLNSSDIMTGNGEARVHYLGINQLELETERSADFITKNGTMNERYLGN